LKFCPKCEVKLKKSDSGLQCSKCGYTEGEANQPKKIVEEEQVEESILAFEGDEGEESLPTIKIECEKCGHDEAIWWMLQTRSADEPTTQFYHCTKCKNTWRNYA